MRGGTFLFPSPLRGNNFSSPLAGEGQGGGPKEGYDVARALRRQGFPRLAWQVCARLLNGVNVAGENAELLYVSPDGHVHYDHRGREGRGPAPVEIAATNVPEPVQAWTVSAILAIKWRLGSARAADDPTPAHPGWRLELEEEVLGRMPPACWLRTEAERAAVYARRGNFVINVAAGIARDRAARGARRGSAAGRSPSP